LKTLALLIGALLIPGAAFAAEQSIAGASPKLTAMFEAKGSDGKPVITSEQRTYFNGLNDNLKEQLNQVVEKEIITRPEHLAVLLALQLRPQKMELVLQNNCILCHTDSQIQSPEDLFTLEPPSNHSHMNLREVVDDVHFRRGLSCAGCHGGDATAAFGHAFVKEWPEKDREKDRGWIVYFCARCHSDPALMHQFNPALPTDQLAKFKESPHGRTLLVQHDNRAPQCISCHGVHGIRPAKDPLSKVYPQRVPETCGACHGNPKTMAGFKGPDGLPLPTSQLAEYRMSVHGRALLERGDLGAPACNTCHGNHAAIPPGISQVSRSCSLCHSANASLFDGSKHKQAFNSHNWPECGKCHGNHAIMKTHDSMLATGPGGLCGDCHRQYAKTDPKCIATANFFRETITKMATAHKNFTADSEALAAKGLDVEPINNQLNDLTDSLKKSRTYVHSFSKDTFRQVALPGEEAIQHTDALVSKAHGEYKFRQIGLAVSIALIGLLMLTIYLKLRQLEK
jgi:hypothetical protein